MSKVTKPLALNNGVYLRTTEFNTATHLDKSHAVNYLNKGKTFATDLGIQEPYITSGYVRRPYLYGFSNLKSNRVYVKNGMFTFKYPTHDEPCYIVEDMSGTSTPGAAGEKFKIKVNKPKYGNGYILAIDQHSPEQLLVTPDEIIESGDGAILTVQYYGIDPANRHFPKEYLKPNTKLFAIGTVGSEYHKRYSEYPGFSGGMRTYFNQVGDSTSQLHFEVTRDAAYTMTDKYCVAPLDMHREIIEMYRFRPGSLGHDLSLTGQSPHMLGKAYKQKYKDKHKMKMNEDIVQRLWIPKMEQLGMALVDNFVDTKAIWAAGGPISYDGKTKVNTAIGLFHQLNMGNQYNINPYTFTVEKLENIIAEKLKDRLDPYNTNNVIEIGVGIGMYTLLGNQLSKRIGANNMTLNSEAYISGHGKNSSNLHLKFDGPRFDSWVMANGFGTIKMKLIPALNPTDANSQVNPMLPLSKGVGGHRLSSYMIIIDDITSNDAGNIVELVHATDWDFQRRVKIGKLNYLGMPMPQGVFASADDSPGYKFTIEKRDKAYHVVDINKSLLIKPYDPRTGRALYDGFFKG